MNVNFLGEAILGEEEARHRLLLNLQGLQSAEVEVISIKISTIYSQISPLARDHTVATLCDRLELLYRTAAHLTFTRPDGETAANSSISTWKSTATWTSPPRPSCGRWSGPGWRRWRRGSCCRPIFPTRSPIRSGFASGPAAGCLRAGPPSPCGSSRAPTWKSERCEASQKGWPQAPYMSKLETDANFHRMV